MASLTRQQKEAIGLLQIGTFLEYFDLMLYVHMAVLLNELFFPAADPHTASLVAAFAFCSTYVLRPFGALLFGYIGDNIGRRTTVIITTMMMSTSCIVMATVPTYAQIGIFATWIVTACRIIQGMSSMGEIMGAIVYITESTTPPAQYTGVASIILASSVGGAVALAIANLVTHCGMNWRIAFWIGAVIAVVGSLARTRLRETPEFISHLQKKRERKKLQKSSVPVSHTNRRDMLAYFCTECSYPFVFYVAFIYFNPTLKSLGYSSEDIIFHNFLLSLFQIAVYAILVYIVRYIHPIPILKFKSIFCFFIFCALPFLLHYSSSAWHIFVVQCLLLIGRGGTNPADPICISRFPIGKRFTLTNVNYASSRALMHIISSFGLVYLSGIFGHYALAILGIPIFLAYIWGARHFESLEKLQSKAIFKALEVAPHVHAA
ncbi:MFS transporter [Candidatus Finniella inopinata]|uniref:MFS transporter n=1 Tax=Candidatus Finniella inopinata TaxID=1696036 RepID=A0A4Q7DI56_9PROT|nr:MFS transporter [Candidatus Finniella inopinata]RZI46463.1 MFS transporter [Candidatus Finniella inopinata]